MEPAYTLSSAIGWLFLGVIWQRCDATNLFLKLACFGMAVAGFVVRFA